MGKADRQNGQIKNIVNEKGFGFITPEHGDTEFFFHYTGLVGVTLDQLRQGTRVTFIASSGPKGPRAERIELV